MQNKTSPEFTQLIKASRLYQDFVSAISAPEITHVSFDVFDTLLRRKCHYPKNIFSQVIERLPADILTDFVLTATEYQHMRISAERLARQKINSEKISFDDIFKQMALPQAHIDALKTKEVELELEQSFADPFCALLIKAVQKLDKQVLFISDMYLPHAIIQQLIDNACQLTDYQLFVSSEFGKTKFTGQLFVHVLAELGINADKLVHIGDHPTSDVRLPRLLGINSFLFNLDKNFIDVLRRERHYRVDLPAKVRLARTLASLLMPKYENDDLQIYYQMGARLLGPILTQMSQWVIDSCLQLKIGTILAMMREGEIFDECINRHINWKSISTLTSVKFYVSRKSTYLPSMINADIKDAIAKTLTRRSYTVGDLINEFAINTSELMPLLSLPMNGLNKVDVSGQNALTLVNQVFDNAAAEVDTHIRKNHQLFIEYLNQILDLQNVEQSFASLDLGPGATIAHQLSKAATLQAKVNYQLFSSERGYAKTDDIMIKSFLPFIDKTQEANSILARSPEVFEYFLVGKSGTTLGYERHKGKVQPVCEERHLTNDKTLQYQAFSEGVRAFQIAAQSLNIEPADLNERVSYTQMLCRLIDCPTSEEVEMIGQCQHEDNFGSQHTYNIIKANNITKVEAQGVNDFYLSFCKQMDALQREMPWPQGVITHLSTNYLSDITRANAQEYVHFSAVNTLIDILLASNITEIIVYGAGDFFIYLYDFLIENNIKVRRLVDRQAEFIDFNLNEIHVESLHECDFSGCSTIVIASGAFIDEIKADLSQKIDLKKYNIINI